MPFAVYHAPPGLLTELARELGDAVTAVREKKSKAGGAGGLPLVNPHPHRAPRIADQITLPHRYRAFDPLAPAVVAEKEFMFNFNSHVAISLPDWS